MTAYPTRIKVKTNVKLYTNMLTCWFWSFPSSTTFLFTLSRFRLDCFIVFSFSFINFLSMFSFDSVFFTNICSVSGGHPLMDFYVTPPSPTLQLTDKVARILPIFNSQVKFISCIFVAILRYGQISCISVANLYHGNQILKQFPVNRRMIMPQKVLHNFLTPQIKKFPATCQREGQISVCQIS